MTCLRWRQVLGEIITIRTYKVCWLLIGYNFEECGVRSKWIKIKGSWCWHKRISRSHLYYPFLPLTYAHYWPRPAYCWAVVRSVMAVVGARISIAVLTDRMNNKTGSNRENRLNFFYRKEKMAEPAERNTTMSFVCIFVNNWTNFIQFIILGRWIIHKEYIYQTSKLVV